MRHPKFIALVIFVLFFSIGVATLSPSMITWDEPENYFVGRVYLRSLTGLSLPQALPFRNETHWERYPPFAITIASGFSWMLSETLHLVTPVVAHHIVVVLFGTLAALATYAIAIELTGSVGQGVIAAGVLFFSPIFFGHVGTNIKDIPQAAMFTMALYAGLFALRKKTDGSVVLAGIVWGLALATKVNAAFVGIILLVYAVMSKKKLNIWVYGAAALGALAVCWPWLVTNPVKHVGQIIQYIGEVGRGLNVLAFGHMYRAGVDVPWWYAPGMVIVQTPLVILIFALFGLIFSKKRTLPVVWLLVVFARYLDPHTIIYNGVRHVMEVFGAIALLAGMGIEEVVLRVPRSLRSLRLLILGMIVVSLAMPVFSLYPYEAMYYNELVGGPKYASESFDFDYWGFSVGELVDRVNAVEKDTTKKVYVLWLGFPAVYFPKNRLQFVTTQSEQADYVIIPNSRNFFDGAIRYWEEHGRLVYTVTKGGATMGYLFATQK